jgi:hypothetical protein
VLAESEAQLAAGQIVPGEEVMCALDECIARLESRYTTGSRRLAAQQDKQGFNANEGGCTQNTQMIRHG